MSFLTKLFGRSEKGKAEVVDAGKATDAKPEPKLEGDETVLRQPDERTPLTKKKGPELTALEMAQRKDWEVKTLPEWKPGDEILGLYRVEKKISGGMGHVYIALHQKWNRKIAIKAPNQEILSDKDHFARILREANCWIELGMHPHIAYCYYVRNLEEVPHIVVEYVDGGNLRQWIQEGKCIDYRVNLDLALQFCHGMAYAHSRGMIHRDIKPENILLTQDGMLKITDFGLVRKGDIQVAPSLEIDNKVAVDGSNLTSYGVFMGTEGYMAPEQAEDPHGVDERADIFAFGICLYEMFCGKQPYEITYGAKQEAPNPIELSRDRSFSPAVAEVLSRCIQWEREQRFSSFTELIDSLTAIYRDLYQEDSLYARFEPVGLEAGGLNNQGVSYWELGQFDKAQECFRKAVDKEGLHPQANWNLGNFEMLNAALAHPNWQEMTLNMLKSILQESGIAYKETEGLVSLVERNQKFLEGISYSMYSKLDNINSLTFSPDRQWIAGGDNQGQVHVWMTDHGQFIRSHQGKVKGFIDLQFSPDSQYLHALQNFSTYRSGKKEKYIYKYMVWETRTGYPAKTKQRLSFHHGRIISPDGHMLATSGENNSVFIWKGKDEKDVEKQKKKNKYYRVLSGHTSWSDAFCFSPDNKWLASGSNDKSVRIWNIERGKQVKMLEGHTETVKSVCFSPDNRLLVSGGFDKQAKIWNIQTGQNIKTINFPDVVNSAWFSPNGNYIVIGGQNRSNMALLDMNRGQLIKTIGQYIFGYSGIAFSPDDRFMVTADKDNCLRLWISDLSNMQLSSIEDYWALMKRKRQKEQHLNQINQVISEENYSRAYDLVMEKWSVDGFGSDSVFKQPYDALRAKGRLRGVKQVLPRNRMEGHGDNVESVAVSPDGALVVSGSGDKTVRIWNLHSGEPMHTLTGHQEDVRAVAVSPDGKLIASGSSDQTIKIWDRETKKILYSEDTATHVISLSFSPDSSLLAYASEHLEYIHLLDVKQRKVVCTFPNWGEVQDVCFSPQGQFLASASYEGGTVKLWQIKKEYFNSMKLIHPIKTFQTNQRYVLSIDFSPDGHLLAIGGSEGAVQIWNLERGKQVQTFHNHSNYVESVAFSPQGRILASGSWDKTITLIDLAKSTKIATLTEHKGEVDSIAFSPDGQFLVSGSWDNTVRLWFLVPLLEF